MLTGAVLLAAGLLAGITGAWSPCGFSMVDTLAPHGYAGRMRTTLIACATFSAGALVGGVITFGGLALLGDAAGAGSVAVAAAIALVAAAGEARGARIMPQVRRQVPESWRRVLPLPLAAGLYGVLLGLGFTTFILSFAVWALAGVSVALGDPALGLLVGLGFGIGRALPVVALAPLAETPRGADAHAAMAERPSILRGLRAADAVALAACAAALWAAPAQAASVFAVPATDPSADGGLVAFQQPGAGGVIAGPDGRRPAPGAHPAVGGGKVAWVGSNTIEVRSQTDPAYVVTLPAAGANAVAVDTSWVAWRASDPSGDKLFAAALAPVPGAPRRMVSVRAPTQLGRPALAGDRLLFHLAKASSSRIDQIRLTTGERTTLRRAPRTQLLNPSAFGGRLLYIRSTYKRQQLRLGALRTQGIKRDRALYGTVPNNRRDAAYEPGIEHHRHGNPHKLWPRPPRNVHITLWTTALTADAAYVTRLRQDTGRPMKATLLRVSR